MPAASLLGFWVHLRAASQDFEVVCETVLPIPAQSTVTESVKTIGSKTSPPVEQVKTITLSNGNALASTLGSGALAEYDFFTVR